MIIGFAGYAGAGKNEAATGLQKLGFHNVAFADKLREFLYTLNPVLEEGHHIPFITTKGYILQRPARVRDVIDKFGWQDAKGGMHGPELRRLIQVLGTECGRGLIGEDVWVNATMNNLPAGWVTISDVRFPNEAEAIVKRSGFLIWVEKEGVGPLNSHASENSLFKEDCDFILLNDGTVDDLHVTVRALVTEAIL